LTADLGDVLGRQTEDAQEEAAAKGEAVKERGNAGRVAQHSTIGAGIDLASERHWVCAPTADGTAREVADFGATTAN